MRLRVAHRQGLALTSTVNRITESIIRGNGVQNVQRLCWNSLDTWMTSDIPSEARWRSLNWGVIKLITGVPVTANPDK